MNEMPRMPSKANHRGRSAAPIPRSSRAHVDQRINPMPKLPKTAGNAGDEAEWQAWDANGRYAERFGAGIRTMRANVALEYGLGPDPRIEVEKGERELPAKIRPAELIIDGGPRYAREFHGDMPLSEQTEEWRMNRRAKLMRAMKGSQVDGQMAGYTRFAKWSADWHRWDRGGNTE